MTPIRQRQGSRQEDQPNRTHPPTHEVENTPARPLPGSPESLLALQKRYGNAYVRRMLAKGTLQRQPSPKGIRTNKGNTITWPSEEFHRGRRSKMRRTTKIEADAWGEVERVPKRVKYRREIYLDTDDGAEVYVDIRGVVRLPKGVPLPRTPEAALAISGAEVESQLSFSVKGADFEPFRDYKSDKLPRLSLNGATKTNFPDYAQLPLSIEVQEKLILDYLSGLKRIQKDKDKPKADDDGDSVAETVVDIGTDLIPFVGELKDAFKAITGIDPVTGKKLAWWERILSGIFAIPILGKLFKWVGKGLKYLVMGLAWVGKKLGGFLASKAGSIIEWFVEKLGRRQKRLPSGGTTSNAGQQASQQAGKQATKTGTVWDKITPPSKDTPIRPNTVIPQYFELQTSGGKFFVNSNATKHMEEYVAGGNLPKKVVGKDGKTIETPSNVGDKVSHGAKMRSQAILDSFAEAVEVAEKQGIKWGEIMNVGPWELIIEKVGKNGPLPVVKHAVFRP